MLATKIHSKDEMFKNPGGFECSTVRCPVCGADTLARVTIHFSDLDTCEPLCVDCFNGMKELRGMEALYPDVPRSNRRYGV